MRYNNHRTYRRIWSQLVNYLGASGFEIPRRCVPEALNEELAYEFEAPRVTTESSCRVGEWIASQCPFSTGVYLELRCPALEHHFHARPGDV